MQMLEISVAINTVGEILDSRASQLEYDREVVVLCYSKAATLVDIAHVALFWHFAILNDVICLQLDRSINFVASVMFCKVWQFWQR